MSLSPGCQGWSDADQVRVWLVGSRMASMVWRVMVMLTVPDS